MKNSVMNSGTYRESSRRQWSSMEKDCNWFESRGNKSFRTKSQLWLNWKCPSFNLKTHCHFVAAWLEALLLWVLIAVGAGSARGSGGTVLGWGTVSFYFSLFYGFACFAREPGIDLAWGVGAVGTVGA
jgi:hypothetical protein